MVEMFDAQLLWRASGTVQRFDGSSLGVIEETEGITMIKSCSSFFRADFGYVTATTNPPIPQEPGSVTFSAAAVATAASAASQLGQHARLSDLIAMGGTTSVPAFPSCLSISNPASVANG